MKLHHFILLPLAAGLSGCFDINDELELHPDGSGTVRLETKVAISPEVIQGMMMGGGNSDEGPLIYPPIRKEEVGKFFPQKDFDTRVTLETVVEGESVLKLEAHFKDINALLASPYGRAHALSIHIDGGRLNVRALPGAETLARFAEATNESQMAFVPNMADLQKKKDKMRARFRITFPNDALADGKAGVVEGKSITWVFERSRSKDDDAFAQGLATLLSATCNDSGVNFKPKTPLRLNVTPFSVLTALSTPGAAPVQDRSALAKSAKFTPCALTIQRSIDLSGDSGVAHQNSAELHGLVEVPLEFAPQKWGKVEFQEASDCHGNDLKLQTSRQGYSHSGFSSVRVNVQDGSGAAGKLPNQHLAKIPFQPPSWKCEQIERVRADIDLQYASGSRLLKISNAIPAKWIRKGEDFDGSEMRIESPELREAGLSLSVQMAMEQNGSTMLMLNTRESKTSILDLQMFDATGAPWPTILQRTPDGEEGGSFVVLPGRPKAPLSAALLVNSSESSVRVPIEAENLALRGEGLPPRKTVLGPLDERYAQRRTRVTSEDQTADLPVTDAGPGFLTEPLGLGLTTFVLFPGAEKILPENQFAYMQVQVGAVVSAKLFAPRGRTLRAVSNPRVLRALDDKGRKLNVENAGESDFASGFSILPANAVSGRFELRLPVPAFDTEAIEELSGELLATTVGGWKELVLTNLAENSEHSLGSLLPDASLLLKKVTSKNHQINIEAEIKGTKAIRQLDLQCRIAGMKNVNAHSYDRQATDTSRSITLMVYAFGSQDDVSIETVSLVARVPQDIRRERVQFVLRGLDLF